MIKSVRTEFELNLIVEIWLGRTPLVQITRGLPLLGVTLIGELESGGAPAVKIRVKTGPDCNTGANVRFTVEVWW